MSDLDSFLIEHKDKDRKWLALNSGVTTRTINEHQIKLRAKGLLPEKTQGQGIKKKVDLEQFLKVHKKPKFKHKDVEIKKDLEKILLIPDCHFPYENKTAFDLMLGVAKDFKPDHVLILGDFIDFYSVSSHDKNPERAGKLTEEISSAVEALWKVKDLGAKNNVFIAGNHCDRLTRYLMQKAPELWGIVSVQSVLALDKLGFQYVPYRQHYKKQIA